MNSLQLAVEKGQTADVLLEIKWRCVSSLYFCAKVLLGYKLLTDDLHLPLCDKLQATGTRKLYQWPRGHFKTTIASKSFPIWRTLPIDTELQDYILTKDYLTETALRELMLLHSPNSRWLIVSSTDENAKKILSAIRYQFESNQMIQALWPEILPNKGTTWNSNELCLNRTEQFSESTYEALGVGGAVQSRHYDGIIEDDLVGKDALESESVMKRVIDYHVLLEGAYDRPDTAENLVIGNRWAFNDLNSWIEENQPWYEIYTRSAIEDEKPIFPRRFSLEGLHRIRKTQGDYFFSCQYLNNPIAPGAHDFEPEWLKRFKLVEELDANGRKLRKLVREDGKIVFFDQLNRFLLIDPAREGKKTNARHAMLVVGVDKNDDRWIMRTWAEKGSTDQMLKKGFEFYETYRCQKAGIEGYGGDAHLKNYMNYMSRAEKKRMNLIVFNKSTTKSKEERIRGCAPHFELGKVAVIDTDTQFSKEYIEFPAGKTVDILDAYSHADEICRRPVGEEERGAYQQLINKLEHSVNERTGY